MKIMGALVMMIAAFVSDDGKQAFVDVGEEIPTIMLDVRYASSDNFIGRPIAGYKTSKIFISGEAATALKGIQAELQQEGLSLKILMPTARSAPWMTLCAGPLILTIPPQKLNITPKSEKSASYLAAMSLKNPATAVAVHLT